jgi:hypothetical protein
MLVTLKMSIESYQVGFVASNSVLVVSVVFFVVSVYKYIGCLYKVLKFLVPLNKDHLRSVLSSAVAHSWPFKLVMLSLALCLGSSPRHYSPRYRNFASEIWAGRKNCAK